MQSIVRSDHGWLNGNPWPSLQRMRSRHCKPHRFLDALANHALVEAVARADNCPEDRAPVAGQRNFCTNDWSKVEGRHALVESQVAAVSVSRPSTGACGTSRGGMRPGRAKGGGFGRPDRGVAPSRNQPLPMAGDGLPAPTKDAWDILRRPFGSAHTKAHAPRATSWRRHRARSRATRGTNIGCP